MSNKQLLDQIQTSLKAGEITADELKALLKKTDKQTQVELQPGKHIHFSATSVLYYIGGLIMFGAQVALLVQSWDTLGSFGRIVMTLVIGLMVWAFSVLLNKNQTYGPRYKEVADAVMLTGSLGVSTGVFVTINEIAQKVGNTVGPWHIVYGLCVIAIAHWLLDAIVRKDLSILFAMLATAASITAFLFAVLQDVVSDTPEYGALSFVAGALVFAGLATAVAKDNLRAHLKYPVWSVSAFVVFAAIFGLASGGNLKVLWQLLYPFMLYGAFAISAAKRLRTFLFTGGFYLFAYIMLIAIQYFGDNGAGLAAALAIGGIGVIASGIFLANFNDRHFKQAK